jgi:formylmethanofuran dehydrogenase subunit B
MTPTHDFREPDPDMADPIISRDLQALCCPFCGLGCDDLSLGYDAAAPVVDARGCGIAAARFADLLSTPGAGHRARLRGEPAPPEQALEEAARLLKSARLPLFAGLRGDLTDLRGVLQLAALCGGMLEHADGAALASTSRVLEETGWLVTSLGEARNRADLVVIVGDGVPGLFPRLGERVLRASERLHGAGPPRLIVLGEDRAAADALGAEQIAVARADLRDFIGVLRALLDGRVMRGDAFSAAAPPAEDLAEDLAEALAAARYPVLCFSAAALGGEDADLVIRALGQLVRALSAHGRAALLPLGGSDGAVTAGQVCGWQTGFGAQLSFATGLPVYRPGAGCAEDLLQRDGVDLLVWLDTLGGAPPPRAEVPTIALGHPAMRFEREPDIFIPLAAPGVHRHGAVHRGDGHALLPLRALVDSDLPPAERVLGALADLLRPAASTPEARAC